MAKRPGSFVFTFSKKNEDIKELLDLKKSEDVNFVKTDYICEAVRFYENHKNDLAKQNFISEDRIREMIYKVLEERNMGSNEEDANIIKTSLNIDDSDIPDDYLEED